MNPVKIVVEYEDGSKREVLKGAVCILKEEDVSIEFLNCEKFDTVRLTIGMVEMENKLGLMDEMYKHIKHNKIESEE